MIEYKMMCGDTLIRIAKKYNVPLSDLIRLNNPINPNICYEGRIIKINK